MLVMLTNQEAEKGIYLHLVVVSEHMLVMLTNQEADKGIYLAGAALAAGELESPPSQALTISPSRSSRETVED
jgi:hypothetical protein